MKPWITLLALLAPLSAMAGENPYLTTDELLICRTQGLVDGGRWSPPFQASWQGDGIYPLEAEQGAYYTDHQELDRPGQSLAMVGFTIGQEPASLADTTYGLAKPRVDLLINTTDKGEITFTLTDYFITGKASSIATQTLSADQFKAGGRKVELLLSVPAYLGADYTQIRTQCSVNKRTPRP